MKTHLLASLLLIGAPLLACDTTETKPNHSTVVRVATLPRAATRNSVSKRKSPAPVTITNRSTEFATSLSASAASPRAPSAPSGGTTSRKEGAGPSQPKRPLPGYLFM